MTDTVLCKIYAAPARRVFGLTMLMILGFVLLFLAFVSPSSFLYKIMLALLGLGTLWIGRRMHRGTRQGIELREEGLFLTNGTVIAEIGNIKKVERGIGALKPSNGFSITLHEKTENAWVPGLYWRLGRFIGIGGVTPPADGKMMADALASMLSERQKGV